MRRSPTLPPPTHVAYLFQQSPPCSFPGTAGTQISGIAPKGIQPALPPTTWPEPGWTIRSNASASDADCCCSWAGCPCPVEMSTLVSCIRSRCWSRPSFPTALGSVDLLYSRSHSERSAFHGQVLLPTSVLAYIHSTPPLCALCPNEKAAGGNGLISAPLILQNLRGSF